MALVQTAIAPSPFAARHAAASSVRAGAAPAAAPTRTMSNNDQARRPIVSSRDPRKVYQELVVLRHVSVQKKRPSITRRGVRSAAGPADGGEKSTLFERRGELERLVGEHGIGFPDACRRLEG